MEIHISDPWKVMVNEINSEGIFSAKNTRNGLKIHCNKINKDTFRIIVAAPFEDGIVSNESYSASEIECKIQELAKEYKD